jgi:iron-sulfur cluster assembly accessory protein
VIVLTASAAAQLKVLVQSKGLDPATAGLRLSVEKGGCAGMQYAMDISPAQTGDVVVERDGARLFVAGDSLKWLDGCEIDYEDGLSGAGFRVKNPHATRSCGCGTSFEPADKAGA